jgi:hypothetical protein
VATDVNMEHSLNAPVYEPATAFHRPVAAPFEFGVDSASIEELMAKAATCAIVIAHAPWVPRMFEAEHFKPFRSTFTLRDMAFFIPTDTSPGVAAIDAALRQLPPSEWAHVR